jgi:hypothetical protein
MAADAMFAPLPGGDAPRRSRSRADAWTAIIPVPADAPKPPAGHPTHGRPVHLFAYRDAAGQILGYVARFQTAEGKTFQPLTFCRNEDGRTLAWRWKSWPDPRPLYGLDRLAAHADEPGSAYAEAVARALRGVAAASVEVITPPDGVSEGWDAADAETEGWDSARALALVEAAQPMGQQSASRTAPDGSAAGKSSKGGEDGGRQRMPPQRDNLVAMAEGVELWHSMEGESWATIQVDGHFEHWGIRSKAFKSYLAGKYYDATGGVPGRQSLEDALCVLEMKCTRGPEYRVFLRTGEVEGAFFLDLADTQWRAIKITAHGWEVCNRPPVKFMRSQAMQSLPEPVIGAEIHELTELLNCRSDGDTRLLVAWLVAAMRPTGPFPVLAINGEQGSAKSSTTRLLKMLIDPTSASIRQPPQNGRDLVASARNSWVLAFDNLSEVQGWLSDALCCLSTGGGYSCREMYANGEEFIFEGQRPLILNGIPSVVGRPDLADRCLSISLKAIPEDRRRPESELKEVFRDKAPIILGALCNAVSGAMRALPSIKLERLPRMADFALWATAAEYTLGWEPGDFMAAYSGNRAGTVESAIDNDPIASAVRSLVEHHDWEGTATDLMTALADLTPSSVVNGRYWPTHYKIRDRLNRAAGPLRNMGIEIDTELRANNRNRDKIISIRKPQRG